MGDARGDFKPPTALLTAQTQRRAVSARLALARPWAAGQGYQARQRALMIKMMGTPTIFIYLTREPYTALFV
jgi:hypothetical protein